MTSNEKGLQMRKDLDEIASYQKAFDDLMEMMSSAPSDFSKAEQEVMEDAAISLKDSLPNPGIQVGEKVPLFSLENAFGNLQETWFRH